MIDVTPVLIKIVLVAYGKECIIMKQIDKLTNQPTIKLTNRTTITTITAK